MAINEQNRQDRSAYPQTVPPTPHRRTCPPSLGFVPDTNPGPTPLAPHRHAPPITTGYRQGSSLPAQPPPKPSALILCRHFIQSIPLFTSSHHRSLWTSNRSLLKFIILRRLSKLDSRTHDPLAPTDHEEPTRAAQPTWHVDSSQERDPRTQIARRRTGKREDVSLWVLHHDCNGRCCGEWTVGLVGC